MASTVNIRDAHSGESGQNGSGIPDSGVHSAGRYRSSAKDGRYVPEEVQEVHNFGPGRVSFGLDPQKPHAPHMTAKETPARHGMAGVLELNASAALSVQQWRCVMVRNRNADCMQCAHACTSGCITVEDDRLCVDASKCVGCGTCATVCPTCALESRNPTDGQLLEAVRRTRGFSSARAIIGCALLVQALEGMLVPDALAQVVCLGRVDESLVAQLAAQHVGSVVLAHGVCEMCEQRTGRDCACMVAESANQLLAAWGSACTVELVKGVPESVLEKSYSVQDVQYRLDEFFSCMRANGPVREREREECDSACSSSSNLGQEPASSLFIEDAAIEREVQEAIGELQDHAAPAGVLKVMTDGTLPHFVPARRERLLDALSQLGSPVEESVDTRLWGCVVIDGSTCSSCRMCATFCPTGAIAKFGEQDSDDFGIEHYPGDCVNCGTCKAICPEDAIHITPGVSARYLLGGEVHRYKMLPRAVALNNAHQIVNTMRSHIDGDIFER